MLRKYRARLLAAFLAVLSLVPLARAQARETIARVNVPFAFQCGLQHYPAGMYDMIRLSADIVQMRGASHSGVAMMRMDVNRLPAKTGKAVFSVYGNQYFLHEMWTKESTDHVTFNVFRASGSSRWLRTVFTSPTFNWRCSMFPASRSFIASLRLEAP